MFKFFITIIFTFFILTQVSLANEVVEQNQDAVLAVVNGEPIILSDVLFETEKEEFNIANSLDSKTAKELILKIRREFVDELIDRKLVVAEYNKAPFPIENEYITSYIDDMARESGIVSRKEFYKNLRAANINVNEFKEKIRERVIVQFTVGKEIYNYINISPKTLHDYYQKNLDNEFSEPEKITLMVIFLSKANENYETIKTEVANSLKQDANSFAYLASKYSDLLITKEHDGILGEFSIDEIRDEFKDFVSKKELGIVSDAIELDDGIYYLMLKDIKSKKTVEFKSIEQELRNRLEAELREKLYKKFINKLRNNAIIEYYF